MTSGVAFDERHDAAGRDAARLHLAADIVAEAAKYRCDQNPERFFHDSSLESQWLGMALESAVGVPLAGQLQSRPWQPMDASVDAPSSTDDRGDTRPSAVSM